jgi:triosephosphate isomerase
LAEHDENYTFPEETWFEKAADDRESRGTRQGIMVEGKSRRRLLLAGNWKMNGLRASIAEIRALGRALSDAPGVDVLICPPVTVMAEAAKAAEGTRVSIGGQDCHARASGAFTGDISAEMLRDAGASHVILGHSERRQYHAESDAVIAEKIVGARRAGLSVILCVGETESVRDAGKAEAFVTEQLRASIPGDAGPDDLTIAYEPVWAIGTGRTPTPGQVAAMHLALREALAVRFSPADAVNIRLIYGGSVKPDNAAELLSVNNVDGALVGGASLKASDFLAIIGAAGSPR